MNNRISIPVLAGMALCALSLIMVPITGNAKALPKNSVGTQQLKKNAVTTTKIRNNAVVTSKIRNNAVTTTKIRNGAVTGAKIAGANTAAQGDVLTATGTGGAVFRPIMQRTIIVSPVIVAGTPDPVQSGTALLNAVGSATASATDPVLIQVEPGIYDLGTTSLNMKAYVSVRGSGEAATTITSQVSSNTAGTINLAANSELSDLTVDNTGAGTYAISIYATGAIDGSSRVSRVTVRASGTGNNDYGVYVDNTGASGPVFSNVTITSAAALTGGGVTGFLSTGSAPVFYNGYIELSGGSNINYGINITNGSPSLLNNSVNVSGATMYNYGLLITGAATPVINNNIISASGGTTAINIGLLNASTSPISMTNMEITVSGGSKMNNGIYNSNAASLGITNVEANASGGTSNFGMYNFGTPTSVSISNSSISGNTNSIFNKNASTVKVYNSTLTGLTSPGAGTITCSGVSETTVGTFTAGPAACP